MLEGDERQREVKGLPAQPRRWDCWGLSGYLLPDGSGVSLAIQVCVLGSCSMRGWCVAFITR